MILDDVPLQMALRVKLFRAEDAAIMSRQPDVFRLDVASYVGFPGADLSATLASPSVVARRFDVAVDHFIVLWKVKRGPDEKKLVNLNLEFFSR